MKYGSIPQPIFFLCAREINMLYYEREENIMFKKMFKIFKKKENDKIESKNELVIDYKMLEEFCILNRVYLISQLDFNKIDANELKEFPKINI